MQTKVQKWGNSLALRIPKAYALAAGLQEDAPIDLVLENGKLTITPVVPAGYSLDKLLAQITDDNVHDEIDTGAPQGVEVW
ncbi:MAG: AbrB/MazE/SpoVT family DNA-binding domain-containing protein [Caldilineaceae bacterium]|nr:AbrB/MazE/SpoVT family DNA-binding domain-containing protein [Caldilineaceae bacterium]